LRVATYPKIETYSLAKKWIRSGKPAWLQAGDKPLFLPTFAESRNRSAQVYKKTGLTADGGGPEKICFFLGYFLQASLYVTIIQDGR
jgi:hypothetical protein